MFFFNFEQHFSFRKACPCAVEKDSREMVKSYQQQTKSLSSLYQDKEDFTVVVQDFAVDAIPPTLVSYCI